MKKLVLLIGWCVWLTVVPQKAIGDWWYWEGGWYGTVPYTAPTPPDWGSLGTIPYNPPVVPDLPTGGSTVPYYTAPTTVTNGTGTIPHTEPPTTNSTGGGTVPYYPSDTTSPSGGGTVPYYPPTSVVPPPMAAAVGITRAGGWVGITIRATPGSWSLHGSQDMKTWVGLAQVTIGPTGEETVFLPPTGPRQFFRIVGVK